MNHTKITATCYDDRGNCECYGTDAKGNILWQCREHDNTAFRADARTERYLVYTAGDGRRIHADIKERAGGGGDIEFRVEPGTSHRDIRQFLRLLAERLTGVSGAKV